MSHNKGVSFNPRQSLLSCPNLRPGQTLLEKVHPVWLQPAHPTGHSGDHPLQVTAPENHPDSPRKTFLFLTSLHFIVSYCFLFYIHIHVTHICTQKLNKNSIFLVRSCSEIILKCLRVLFKRKHNKLLWFWCVLVHGLIDTQKVN